MSEADASNSQKTQTVSPPKCPCCGMEIVAPAAVSRFKGWKQSRIMGLVMGGAFFLFGIAFLWIDLHYHVSWFSPATANLIGGLFIGLVTLKFGYGKAIYPAL